MFRLRQPLIPTEYSREVALESPVARLDEVGVGGSEELLSLLGLEVEGLLHAQE